MTKEKRTSPWIRTSILKIWIVLVLFLLAAYRFLPGTRFGPGNTIDAHILDRAKSIGDSIESRILHRSLDALNTLGDRLRSEPGDPARILEEWLLETSDFVSISLWLEERPNPFRVVRKGFWSRPEVTRTSVQSRRQLVDFLLPESDGVKNEDSSWFIGSSLSSDVLGYPLISLGFTPADTWIRALDARIALESLPLSIRSVLEENEDILLLDGDSIPIYPFDIGYTISVPANEEGIPVWTGSDVSARTPLESLSWILVYHQKNAQQMAESQATSPVSGNLILVIIGCTLVLGVFLSFWIDRPLNRLISDATDIARGDFVLRLDRQSDRILDRLAKIFNYMAEEMEHLQGLDVGEIINEKNKTETILRNIADGVVVTGPEDTLLVMNAVSESWFGVSEKSVLNTPIDEHIKNKNLLGLIQKVKNDKPQNTAEFSFKPLGAREDKIFQAHASCVRDPEDRLVGVVTVIRDVTKEREADRIKTELVSMVAHELKSPLTSIFGFSELLLESKLEDPSAREYAQVILTESTRLTDLVNKFLDLSRLEAGRTEIRVIPFVVGDVVDKILDTYGGQAKKKEIRTIADIPTDLSLAMGDPDMIEQVLLNLFSNAVKYSPKRSKVGIEAKETDDSIIISVIDNGYGIPKESLPNIFDKFYRVVESEETEEGEEVEGSGLGLTLAKAIVEQHGGTIQVNSRLGVGSVFSITLPKCKE